MPNMPAFCESCGLVFPSGFVIENSIGLTLSGVTSKCPQCGGIGRVPDGLYNVLGKVVQVLAGPGKTFEQLTRLQVVLKAAQAKKLDTPAVQKAILDSSPELAGLASALPATRTELYAFITVVLTLLALLVSAYGALKSTGPSQVEIDQMVSKALEQSARSSKNSSDRKPLVRKAPKVGRNEPCPCGSGNKYKRCCIERGA